MVSFLMALGAGLVIVWNFEAEFEILEVRLVILWNFVAEFGG
jgi:hypothetical protein